MVGRGRGRGATTASNGRELDLVIANKAVGAASGSGAARETGAVVGMRGRGDSAATGGRSVLAMVDTGSGAGSVAGHGEPSAVIDRRSRGKEIDAVGARDPWREGVGRGGGLTVDGHGQGRADAPPEPSGTSTQPPPRGRGGKEGSAEQKKYLDVVDKRVTHLYDDTLMVAAGLLDPQGHYKYKLASDRVRQRAFTKAIMKIADPEDALEAIEQFGQYSSFRGTFDTQIARDGASRLSPTQWWLSFGGDVGTLQKYALHIVSHCTSSSGCERNWSTFALIHTQVRNRLGYEKLHKLVYVHYNLKLRVQQIEGEMKERDIDPCGMMLNATLYDNANPIMDWLTNSRSESEPLLDVDDYENIDEDTTDAYHDDYNLHLPTPTHDCVDPVLIEEPLLRPLGKRKTRMVNTTSIEEVEEELEAETDDDTGDDGENGEFPLDANAPVRKSTRRRQKSRKLLDTDITSTT